jgi:hypothetical protein
VLIKAAINGTWTGTERPAIPLTPRNRLARQRPPSRQAQEQYTFTSVARMGKRVWSRKMLPVCWKPFALLALAYHSVSAPERGLFRT